MVLSLLSAHTHSAGSHGLHTISGAFHINYVMQGRTHILHDLDYTGNWTSSPLEQSTKANTLCMRIPSMPSTCRCKGSEIAM